MSKVEKLEQQMQSLSPEELAQFRAWFQEFDWAVADVQAGKVDALADKALQDHAGRRIVT